ALPSRIAQRHICRALAIAATWAEVNDDKEPMPPVLALMAFWMAVAVASILFDDDRAPWQLAQLAAYNAAPSITGAGADAAGAGVDAAGAGVDAAGAGVDAAGAGAGAAGAARPSELLGMISISCVPLLKGISVMSLPSTALKTWIPATARPPIKYG